jgi:hypothetical protein
MHQVEWTLESPLEWDLLVEHHSDEKGERILGEELVGFRRSGEVQLGSLGRHADKASHRATVDVWLHQPDFCRPQPVVLDGPR